MEKKVLRLCPLFEGMSDEELTDALRFFGASVEHYGRGEMLLMAGETVPRFALVLTGTVQVMMDDIDGHHMIMATVVPGQTFGESLCYRGVRESPVYAAAAEESSVVWLKTDKLRFGPDGHCAYCQRFINMLTMKTLAMNDRIQVLSKPTLREKLLTLFTQFSTREGTEFQLPFDRSDMATYLGVNRSALSRELSRLREEGLIDFHKNRFTINSHQ